MGIVVNEMNLVFCRVLFHIAIGKAFALENEMMTTRLDGILSKNSNTACDGFIC